MICVFLVGLVLILLNSSGETSLNLAEVCFASPSSLRDLRKEGKDKVSENCFIALRNHQHLGDRLTLVWLLLLLCTKRRIITDFQQIWANTLFVFVFVCTNKSAQISGNELNCLGERKLEKQVHFGETNIAELICEKN